MQPTNPYLKNCPYCNAVNDKEAKFCKSCGQQFVQYQSYDTPAATGGSELKYLVIILAFICFESLFYKFLEYVVSPIVTDGRGYGEGMSLIYTVSSWGFNLAMMIMSIIFAVKSKNKMARVVLIAYSVIILINFILYNIVPLFRNANDFIYYNF